MAQLTPVIDQAASFQVCIFMAGGPKAEFGNPDRQATDANGIPKWEVACSVMEPPVMAGRRPNLEPLTVTITSDIDPTENLVQGQPVVFDTLRVGATAPEASQGDDGRARVRGGKFYYSAQGVRAAAPVGSKS
jgi:hypothetical protein